MLGWGTMCTKPQATCLPPLRREQSVCPLVWILVALGKVAEDCPAAPLVHMPRRSAEADILRAGAVITNQNELQRESNGGLRAAIFRSVAYDTLGRDQCRSDLAAHEFRQIPLVLPLLIHSSSQDSTGKAQHFENKLLTDSVIPIAPDTTASLS